MLMIYVYSNETGRQVDSHEDVDNAACEKWVDDHYGTNDYHSGYCGAETSNTVEEEGLD